jgi:hypothetical protein
LDEEQKDGWELGDTMQRINPNQVLPFFERPKA